MHEMHAMARQHTRTLPGVKLMPVKRLYIGKAGYTPPLRRGGADKTMGCALTGNAPHALISPPGPPGSS